MRFTEVNLKHIKTNEKLDYVSKEIINFVETRTIKITRHLQCFYNLPLIRNNNKFSKV